MATPQGAAQVPLRAASKQQEVVCGGGVGGALLIRGQLFIGELHCDHAAALHAWGNT